MSRPKTNSNQNHKDLMAMVGQKVTITDGLRSISGIMTIDPQPGSFLVFDQQESGLCAAVGPGFAGLPEDDFIVRIAHGVCHVYDMGEHVFNEDGEMPWHEKKYKVPEFANTKTMQAVQLVQDALQSGKQIILKFHDCSITIRSLSEVFAKLDNPEGFFELVAEFGLNYVFGEDWTISVE